jgi:hypothetical protein
MSSRVEDRSEVLPCSREDVGRNGRTVEPGVEVDVFQEDGVRADRRLAPAPARSSARMTRSEQLHAEGVRHELVFERLGREHGRIEAVDRRPVLGERPSVLGRSTVRPPLDEAVDGPARS